MTTAALATQGQVRSIIGHVRLQMPRAGKIRLGVQATSQGGKSHPKEVDYFVLDADLPGRADIVRLYGEKPKRLLVTFVSSDPEEVFPQALKAYGRGLGLLCRGDGKTATRAKMRKGTEGRDVIDRDAAGRPLTESCACPCPWLAAKKCRAVGNLTVVLPEVGFSVYQIDTSSWWSMTQLRSDLAYLNTLLSPQGVRGRLLWLERAPKQTHGSGRLETHYPMRLILPGADEYRERQKKVGNLVEKFASVLATLPQVVAESPVGLPHGSPVEEPDLVPESAQVEPSEVAPGAPVAPGYVDEAPDPEGEPGTDEDIDHDERVGGEGAGGPDDPLADSPPTAAQVAEVKRLWPRLVDLVIAAGLEPSAPSPKAAAAMVVKKRERVDVGTFLRDLAAGSTTADRAAEVIEALRRVEGYAVTLLPADSPLAAGMTPDDSPEGKALNNSLPF